VASKSLANDRAQQIVDAMRSAIPQADASILRPSSPLSQEAMALAPIDITVPLVSPSDLCALSWSISANSSLGNPELVLVCDSVDRSGGLGLTLDQLGLDRVMDLPTASDWLPRASHALAAVARARRALFQAQRIVPAVSPTAHHGRLRGGLFAQEQMFREVCIRILLAETASRRIAAERAGVPYRTFCQIMAKLGIATGPAKHAPGPRAHRATTTASDTITRLRMCNTAARVT
jgi:hypothetical protein